MSKTYDLGKVEIRIGGVLLDGYMVDLTPLPPIGEGLRERLFKGAVRQVIREGNHPSGARIKVVMGISKGPRDKDLNGERTRWRREVLTDLGWTRDSKLRARWRPPKGVSGG